MQYIAYFVTAASIIGTVANSLQKRWCFWVWLCTNAFWIGYMADGDVDSDDYIFAMERDLCQSGVDVDGILQSVGYRTEEKK